MAEGLLGLDPDIALALEEVVPQDLLLGGREERWGCRQPRSSVRVGEGRAQCHSKEAERLGVQRRSASIPDVCDNRTRGAWRTWSPPHALIVQSV